jgi:hypothetical protein
MMRATDNDFVFILKSSEKPAGDYEESDPSSVAAALWAARGLHLITGKLRPLA